VSRATVGLAMVRGGAVALACMLASVACPVRSAAQVDAGVQISEEARRTILFIKYDRIDEQTGARSPSIGSGFIVHQAGLVVSAYHVVEAWLEQAKAKQDPEAEKADNPLLGYIGSIHNPAPIKLDYLNGEINSDVALLRLKSPQEYPSTKVCLLPTIAPGAAILAFGFPFGKEFTPFPGLLSNEDAPDGRWSANINFETGASGGPVYDVARGRVIAIVKGGLTLRAPDPTIPGVPVTSVRYVTPIVRLSTILANHGVAGDCGAAEVPAAAPGQIALDDRNAMQRELLRQGEELLIRLKFIENAEFPAKPFRIDTLARRYEGHAPGHVGIDANGGVYYGAYRIQAGPNLDGFLAFLDHAHPSFAKRLTVAGGSKAARNQETRFVAEWRALSQAPEFTAAQLQFILATDFTRLVARLKRPRQAERAADRGLGLDIYKRSLALQAVIFSIANQYGPGTTLPFDALEPLGEINSRRDAELIEALFAARDRISFYFPKITSEYFIDLLKRRNGLEKRDALFMLQNG
jgi:Trypsin-like peptidase domain